jgi:hypothetical protein
MLFVQPSFYVIKSTGGIADTTETDGHKKAPISEGADEIAVFLNGFTPPCGFFRYAGAIAPVIGQHRQLHEAPCAIGVGAVLG